MWRFVTAIVLITLLSSIGIGLLFDWLHQQNNQQTDQYEQQALKAQAQLLQHALTLMPNTAWPQLLNHNNQLSHGYSYQLVQQNYYPLPRDLQVQLQQQQQLLLETAGQLQLYLPLPDHQLLLVSAAKSTGSQNASLWLTLTFYLALAVCILMFLMPFVLRLRRLSLAAQQLGQGKLGSRVAVGTVWYLKELELVFNAMAQRIQTLLDDIGLMSGGLSHELRTPLTRIRMGLDTLAVTVNPTDRRRFEDKINANLDEMEQLLNQILTFSRLQYSLEHSSKTPVCLNEIMQQLLPHYAGEAILVNYHPTACIIQADAVYLKMLLNNLLLNAFTYGKQQVLVNITVHKADVLLTVSDDGEGIPDEHKAKIFQPFVRFSANSAGKTGYGIGLAFVERIASWLNCTVQVSRCELLGGAKFSLQFERLQTVQRSEQ